MSETTPETPGDKLYICPACGARYAEPTMCSNGHEPTEAVEYDRATVEAADTGDEAAIAAVNEQASSTGTTAGIPSASPEAAPEPVDPPAAEPAATATATDASPAAGGTSSSATAAAAGAAGAAASAIAAAKEALATAEAELAKLGL